MYTMNFHDVGSSSNISDLVDGRPEVLEVLEAFGIKLDPWTMIALRCTVEELAEYSAVRHPDELRDAIRARLDPSRQLPALDFPMASERGRMVPAVGEGPCGDCPCP